MQNPEKFQFNVILQDILKANWHQQPWFCLARGIKKKRQCLFTREVQEAQINIDTKVIWKKYTEKKTKYGVIPPKIFNCVKASDFLLIFFPRFFFITFIIPKRPSMFQGVLKQHFWRNFDWNFALLYFIFFSLNNREIWRLIKRTTVQIKLSY